MTSSPTAPNRQAAPTTLACVLIACALLGLAHQAHAKDNTPLINGDFRTGHAGWVFSKAHPFQTEIVEAAALETGKALAIRVGEPPAQSWRVQVRHRLPSGLAARQQVRMTMWLRSPESNPVVVTLQRATRPFTPLSYKQVKLTPQWKRYDFTTLTRDAADQAQLTITAGFGAGTVEIGDIQLSLGEVKAAPATPRDQLAPLSLDGLEGVPGLAAALGADPRSIVTPLDRVKTYSKSGRSEVLPNDTSGQVLRLTTLGKTEWTYQVQAIARSRSPIKKGDTLVIVARWRVVQPNELLGYASLGLFFELTGPPHTKEISRLFTSSGASGDSEESQWQTVVLPFRAGRDYLPERASLTLRIGYGPQTVELSHAAVINLGPDVDPDDVPATRATYGGSAPDADWRAEAEQRIQQHRTGELSVEVVDSGGQPIPNAQVHVEMTRHAFGFGTAINARRFPGGPRAHDAGPYLDKAADLFNWAVFENGMKWKLANNAGYQRQVDRGLSWMEEQGMVVRGHTLIWPSFRRAPSEIAKLRSDPEALRAAIEDQITNTAKKYAGRIYAWDAINEPFKNREFMDILGDEQMVRWLKLAKEADPQALMFINDFKLLSDPSPEPVRVAYYLDLIDTLQAQGAPLEGMGFQAHFSGELTPIDQIIARLDAFAAKGLRLHITEFDIASDDEDLQAAYARDFLTVCYSHPAVEGVVVWGFWAAEMFQPKGALYRNDWSLRPVGEVFQQLIKDQWWTDETLATDTRGAAKTRGYVGEYRITATVDGQTSTANITLDPNGQTVRLTMP